MLEIKLAHQLSYDECKNMSTLKIKTKNKEINLKRLFKNILFCPEKNVYFLETETNETNIWTRITQKNGIISLS